MIKAGDEVFALCGPIIVRYRVEQIRTREFPEKRDNNPARVQEVTELIVRGSTRESRVLRPWKDEILMVTPENEQLVSRVNAAMGTYLTTVTEQYTSNFWQELNQGDEEGNSND